MLLFAKKLDLSQLTAQELLVLGVVEDTLAGYGARGSVSALAAGVIELAVTGVDQQDAVAILDAALDVVGFDAVAGDGETVQIEAQAS